MTSFYYPANNFCTSLTLLYLVYTQCEQQIKKMKSNNHHRGQGDPLKEIYSINSVLYSKNLNDKQIDDDNGEKIEQKPKKNEEKKIFAMKGKQKKKNQKEMRDASGDQSSSSEEEEEVRATVPESYYKSNLEGSLNRDQDVSLLVLETAAFGDKMPG